MARERYVYHHAFAEIGFSSLANCPSQHRLPCAGCAARKGLQQPEDNCLEDEGEVLDTEDGETLGVWREGVQRDVFFWDRRLGVPCSFTMCHE